MPRKTTATRSAAQYNKWVGFSFLVDTLVIAVSLVLAYFIRFRTGIVEIGVYYEGITLRDYAGHICFGITLMMLSLTNFRFYSKEQMLSYTRTIRVILKASLVWLVALLSLTLILK